MPELPSERARDKVGLPGRLFLYTPDQIATMLSVAEDSVWHYLYLDGRSGGAKKADQMMARNIASEGEKPVWRVAEREFVRWLRFKKFRVYETPWGVG